MKLEKPKINSSVFENFSKLTNEDENVRISGAYSLIQQMEKLTTEKVNKNLNSTVIKHINNVYCL